MLRTLDPEFENPPGKVFVNENLIVTVPVTTARTPNSTYQGSVPNM